MTLFHRTIVIVLLIGALYAEASSVQTEYLGLFTQDQKSYTVGKGSDAIVIKRVMTSCAKNKGFF